MGGRGGSNAQQNVGHLDIVDGDIEAFRGKRQRDGAADTAASAGNEGGAFRCVRHVSGARAR